MVEWNTYHKLEAHGKIKNVDKYIYNIQCKKNMKYMLMRGRKSVVNQHNLFRNMLYSNGETTCFGL